MLTEEKLDNIGTTFETSPRRSVKRPAQEMSVSEMSAWRTTKFLKLRTYETNDFYLWGSLENQECKTDPHRREELRNNKGLEISTISGKDLQKFNNNVLCGCAECKQSRAICSTCCNTGELLLVFLKLTVIDLLSSSRPRVSCLPRRGGRRSGGGTSNPHLSVR